MKTLLLVRHAKSSWHDVGLPDFDRPLNERGKHDAPLMAKRVKERKIDIDLFVSSPAKRAKKTAEIFMHELGKKSKKLHTKYSLYEGSVEDFYETIAAFKDDDDIVAIFAHNPGITDFINSLDCYPVYDMPTCAIFAVKIKMKKWKDFKESKKEFLFFNYPKNT